MSNTHLRPLGWLLTFLTTAPFVAASLAADTQLVEVRKIWDQAPHNAFTDLIRRDGNPGGGLFGTA